MACSALVGPTGCGGRLATDSNSVAADTLSVGPLGRTLSLFDGVLTLTVPEGAVSDVVALTVAPAGGYPSAITLIPGTAFELGPSSVRFAVPITVSLRYPAELPAGIRQSELGVYTVRNSLWVTDSTSLVDSASGTVSGAVPGAAVFGALGTPVEAVFVTPSSASLLPGGSIALVPTLVSARGDSLPGRAVAWSSADPAVAAVSPGGVVTAVGEGVSEVIVEAEGRYGFASIEVRSGTASNPGGLNPACSAYPAPAVPDPLRTFYVDAATGNDANDGRSAAAAWQSLDKANQTAQAGDLILLAGAFPNQWINPLRSGTASAKITYRVAPGKTAVVSVGKYDAVVSLNNRSDIVIDGIEFTNAKYPILLSTASNIWIRNIYMHDVSGSLSLRGSSDNRIEDSRFERIGSEASNAGDIIFIQNGSHRNVVARNLTSYGGHGTIWVSYQAASEATADDNIIAHNVSYNPWANNIGLNGKANRTIVECNRIYNSSDGSGANYPRYGLEIEGTNNIVRYNEIFTNGAGGITIQGRTFAGFVQNATGNQVYNNTVWANGGPSLQFVQRDVGIAKDNVVENNIFWQDRGYLYSAGAYAVAADLYNAASGNTWPNGSANGNVVRNNIFPNGQSLLLVIRLAGAGGNLLYTLSEAQATFTGWAGNFQADPLFTNTASRDFTLQAGSPAIDAGPPLPGQPYLGTAPDLGARERQ